MKGSIVPRGKKFSVVVDVGKKPDGKRDQRWYSGYNTKKEAQKDLVRILYELQNGTLIQKRSDTVGNYLSDWIDLREMNMQPNGYENYVTMIKKHINPLIGHYKLEKLNVDNVRHMYKKLYEQGLAPGTIMKVRTVLNSALNGAVEDELIRKNVAKNVKTPPIPRNPLEIWSKSELLSYKERAIGDRFFLLFYTIMHTGFRRGETLGLRISNINFEERKIYLRQAITTKGLSKFLKTDPSWRTIDISTDLAAYLWQAKLQWEIDRQSFEKKHAKNDYVFYTYNGNHITPSNVARELDRIILYAGLSDINTQGLRHTHATHMLMAGVPVKIVSERLGHASIEITLNTYAHVLPTIQAEAVLQYENYLKGPPVEEPELV